MADPLIDSVVAQYQILSRIGGGAMGVVYQARDLKLGRLVALKFLPVEWSHDDDAKQRFVREAQAASSTDHVNICTVHDIQTTDDGRLFIVMAHYDGQTLKQRLAQGQMSIGEALSIAQQVADGLARAHAAGVVHRDIKPGNVILTEDAVKIVDFGLATLAGSVQLTQAGSPMGTVTYMAPEQLRGLGATPQSDVWAVGAMLYELLAGHPPFQGTHAEAISYAIRHDTPPLLRDQRPEVPEEVEQLVFRALHKEPGVRFASGRELARALRQVQGHTVPLELQTAAIEVPRLHGALPRSRATRLWRGLAVTALLAVAAGGAVWWYASRPPVRTFVAVAPVVNGTGDDTLDPYRLGLTLALTRELSESNGIRVLAYQQLLQPLRRFLLTGGDVSSAEALRAVRTGSGAPYLVAPTLLYDRGAWKARAEVQDPSGAVVDRLETAPVESSLTKEAASSLITSLAALVDERLAPSRWWPRRTNESPARFTSLDAARAFEEGLSAYDTGEYAAARDAFDRAAREDPRHPLPAAWQSRIAHVTGDRTAAAEAADRAEARLTNTSRHERLFVQAVAAEARRQPENAAGLYQALAESEPDDPAAWTELAAYQDRAGRTQDAVATYRRVLSLDDKQPGAALELCRLYNSTRLNDKAQARTFGDRARNRYVALGSPVGEAQAMLCLAGPGMLPIGSPQDRDQAMAFATQALSVFERFGLQYNLARAHQYVASAARAQGNLPASAEALVRALASAKAVGNTSLEGTVYTNLGITYMTLGQREKALEYYRESYQTAERRGDGRRAAFSRANAGALLIEFGSPPDEGARFVEGALRVVRNGGDRNFELFCLQVLAVHNRLIGRFDDARKRLAEALTIAREEKFADRVPGLLLDDTRTLMDMGKYGDARDTLQKAIEATGANTPAEFSIELGRLRTRLGDFGGASEALEMAASRSESKAGDLAPRLATALGELAYSDGRVKDARTSFETSAGFWRDDLPDAASVEARAFVGFIDGLDGRASGRTALASSVQQAVRMRRPALEAVTRLLLARLNLHDHRGAEAAAALAPLHDDGLSPELQAQIHYWRAQARGATSDDAPDRREAKRWLDEAQQSVPEELRERYLSRPDLRVMAELRR